MIGVYRIRNKINNHCYIGQSTDILRRWKTHVINSKRKKCKEYNYPLQKAFRKYGISHFEFSILIECEKKDLTRWETFWYDMIKPKYNQIKPDENPVFNSDIEKRRQAIFQTEEYKNKFRRPLTTETKRKISESLKQSESFKLSHNTTDYKKRMNEIRQRGKRHDKPVIVLKNNTPIKEFKSMSDCARWLNETTSYATKNKVTKIKSVCDGERKSAFGYTYSYK